MKVLMVNGSDHERGCTFAALSEIGLALNERGIDYEIFHIGNAPLRDCVNCRKCFDTKDGFCAFNDDCVNTFKLKCRESDGFIFASPVYFGHPSGRLISLLDRAFFSDIAYDWYGSFKHKPAAAAVSARRSGNTASWDVLNKHMGVCQMPIVASTGWNMVHGHTPDGVSQDEEGLQTMRNLGRNMAWLLECIEAGRAAGIEPPCEEMSAMTNFTD